MSEINKIHYLAMERTICAKAQGVFKENPDSIDLELYDSEMQIIVDYARDKISASDMEWILEDCNLIKDINSLQFTKKSYE